MENNDKYIGRYLDNRYEILEKIGEGGMSVVYKARCHRLNRFVAVKILKDELAKDSELRRRFHAESQAVAMLSHPNIMAVYDVSKSGETEYIVMELIEGITLKQYIRRKNQLTWKETMHFTTQICKALQHAHSRGIVHRDIKPQNILLLKDGTVKVADFGIARLQSKQHTLTQQALGSVHYISPEQAKGAPVDVRSDLYSLGVVMYEMMTGKVPFDGETAVSVAIQHINAEPVLPRSLNPDIPVGLEDITMHAMERNLEQRYRSADEMLKDLEEFRKNPDIRFGYSAALVANHEQENSGGNSIRHSKEVKPKKRKPVNNRISKDDYRKTKKRTRRAGALLGVFGVLVVILVLFVFLWRTALRSWLDPKEERVTMPNFVGSYLDTVKNTTEYEGTYVFNVSYEASPEYPAGYILRQSPSANRQLLLGEDGIEVVLTVSSGEATREMPKVLNLDYRDAKYQLENLNMNLIVELQTTASDTVASGYVCKQIPQEGETLYEGMTVYLTYSIGPSINTVPMPDVVGLTVDQAIERLDNYNLDYSLEDQDSSEPAGTVTFQGIPADTEVEPHTKVKLYVSNGSLREDTP